MRKLTENELNYRVGKGDKGLYIDYVSLKEGQVSEAKEGSSQGSSKTSQKHSCFPKWERGVYMWVAPASCQGTCVL